MNEVILTGRLTKDLELYVTNDGTKVLNFTLAVKRRKSKNSNAPEADFINCKAFNVTADNMNSYLKKGSQIGLKGRLQAGSYEDRNTGKKVFYTEVLADEVEFLESKKEAQQGVTDFSNYQPAYNIERDDLPF